LLKARLLVIVSARKAVPAAIAPEKHVNAIVKSSEKEIFL
jgi:hypothetical protein